MHSLQNRVKLRKICFLILLIIGCFSLNANSQNWISKDPEFSYNSNTGEITMKQGVAFLKGVEMQSGEIEVLIKSTDTRSFAGLIFHLDTINFHYEEVYVRNHKNKQPDAMQYSPVFHGFSNWQLFQEYQANQRLDSLDFNHLKIIFNQHSAQIFLNGKPSPIFTIDNLMGEKTGLAIGLQAINGAIFKDFKYKDYAAHIPVASQSASLNQKWIKDYEVSSLIDGFPEELPTQGLSWRKINTGDDGILLISKHVKKSVGDKFEANPVESVIARFGLSSADSKQIQLAFEYTNQAAVFVNGTKIWEGMNFFRQKGSLYRGEFDRFKESNKLYIPIKEGENLIEILVGAKANGWALKVKTIE